MKQEYGTALQRLQQAILDRLWSSGPATADQIREALLPAVPNAISFEKYPELRQRFVDMTVPQAEALGVTRQAVHKKHAKRLIAAGLELRRRGR